MIEDYKIEVVVVVIIASMVTILWLIISFNFPNIQILVLTILIILLPVIYQIGHIYSKESLKAKNEQDYFVLENTIEELEEENQFLKEQKK